MQLIDLGVAKLIIVSLLKGKVVGFLCGKEAYVKLATTHFTYSINSPSELNRRPRTLNDVILGDGVSPIPFVNENGGSHSPPDLWLLPTLSVTILSLSYFVQ